MFNSEGVIDSEVVSDSEGVTVFDPDNLIFKKLSVFYILEEDNQKCIPFNVNVKNTLFVKYPYVLNFTHVLIKELDFIPLIKNGYFEIKTGDKLLCIIPFSMLYSSSFFCEKIYINKFLYYKIDFYDIVEHNLLTSIFNKKFFFYNIRYLSLSLKLNKLNNIINEFILLGYVLYIPENRSFEINAVTSSPFYNYIGGEIYKKNKIYISNTKEKSCYDLIIVSFSEIKKLSVDVADINIVNADHTSLTKLEWRPFCHYTKICVCKSLIAAFICLQRLNLCKDMIKHVLYFTRKTFGCVHSYNLKVKSIEEVSVESNSKVFIGYKTLTAVLSKI